MFPFFPFPTKDLFYIYIFQRYNSNYSFFASFFFLIRAELRVVCDFRCCSGSQLSSNLSDSELLSSVLTIRFTKRN